LIITDDRNFQRERSVYTVTALVCIVDLLQVMVKGPPVAVAGGFFVSVFKSVVLLYHEHLYPLRLRSEIV